MGGEKGRRQEGRRLGSTAWHASCRRQMFPVQGAGPAVPTSRIAAPSRSSTEQATSNQHALLQAACVLPCQTVTTRADLQVQRWAGPQVQAAQQGAVGHVRQQLVLQ